MWDSKSNLLCFYIIYPCCSFSAIFTLSQGQTILNVDVYLPAPVFSHGQLYVAMSRATSRTNIKILALLLDAEAQEEEAKKIDKKN